MENFKGIIWIKNTFSDSKSDGDKAYLIDEEFNHYQLYRKGVYEINDAFFYPFNLRKVKIIGEIQKGKWIMADSIDFLDDSSASVRRTKNYAFKKTEFEDILNSEGSILSVVEQKFETIEGMENSRLWLKANIGHGIRIFTKINETALLFFFQGRISTRELFMLRNDEVYVVEEKIDDKSVFREEYYTEQFNANFLSKVPYVDFHFNSIPKNMRIQNPFESLMEKIELYFINSHETQVITK